MANLICFEGIDGSGKTSQSVQLYEYMKSIGKDVVLLGKKNFNGGNLKEELFMNYHTDLLWNKSKEININKFGDKYWLLLIASWYNMIDDLLIKCSNNKYIIFDGWVYKYISRYMQKEGFTKEYLENVFSGLSTPDLIIYINVNAEATRKRRHNYSQSERGGSDADRYIEYQTKINNVYNNVLKNDQWVTISPAVSDNIKHVHLDIRKKVAQRFFR